MDQLKWVKWCKMSFWDPCSEASEKKRMFLLHALDAHPPGFISCSRVKACLSPPILDSPCATSKLMTPICRWLGCILTQLSTKVDRCPWFLKPHKWLAVHRFFEKATYFFPFFPRFFLLAWLGLLLRSYHQSTARVSRSVASLARSVHRGWWGVKTTRAIGPLVVYWCDIMRSNCG